MKSIVLRVIICVVVLGLQSFLTTRKKAFWLWILPTFSIVGGIVFNIYTFHSIDWNSLGVFVILAICLVAIGMGCRAQNRKKELDKMKAKDM